MNGHVEFGVLYKHYTFSSAHAISKQCRMKNSGLTRNIHYGHNVKSRAKSGRENAVEK